MKRVLIFLGILIFTGFGTNFLIRFLRDGDFYYAEFAASLIGVIMICIGVSLKRVLSHLTILIKLKVAITED